MTQHAPRATGPQPRKTLPRAARPSQELLWSWLAQRACKEAPTTAFFGDSFEGQRRKQLRNTAALYCAQCPVINQCGWAAVITDSSGLWAGNYRESSFQGQWAPLIAQAPQLPAEDPDQ